MKTFMTNIDQFHEGLVKLWTVYNAGGDKTKNWTEEFGREHKFPNCKRELFNPVYELQSAPTREFAIQLRQRISDYQKKYVTEKKSRVKSEEDINEPMSYEEQIQCAIALLKATGEYVIKKKVVTVTLEDV